MSISLKPKLWKWHKCKKPRIDTVFAAWFLVFSADIQRRMLTVMLVVVIVMMSPKMMVLI